MKTVNNQIYDVRGDDYETIKMRVDDSKLAKLYGMLSNIYRNPIGSIVREYASNAHDANVEADNFKNLSWEELCKIYPWINDANSKLKLTEQEYLELKAKLSKAGTDEPIVVSVDRNKMEFYVKDYGIGLSPSRMHHVFFTYLSSTKEDTDGEIGGFGIGAKSALAYTNTFFIDTVYNGVEYNYMMTKNAEGMPEGKLMLSKESNDHNGTMIRIPIKEWSDIKTFDKEIERMLLYMPNVFYAGEEQYCTINKDKLYKGKGWILNSSQRYDQMHIVLDNIPYTIDWGELDIKAVKVPLGLTFSTGEVVPTPSRESLLYTKNTKDKIIERIGNIQDYYYQKKVEESKPTNDLMVAWKALNGSSNKVNLFNGDDEAFYIDLQDLLKDAVGPITSTVNSIPKAAVYAPLVTSSLSLKKLYNLSESSFFAYGEIELGRNATGKLKVYSEDNYYSGDVSYRKVINDLDAGTAVVTTKLKVNQLEVHYFLEKKFDYGKIQNLIRSGNWISNLKIYRLRNMNHSTYERVFQLKQFEKSQWDPTIEGIKAVDNFIKDHAHNLDVLVDPNYNRLYRAGKCKFKPKATSLIPDGVYSTKIYYKGIEASGSTVKQIPAGNLKSLDSRGLPNPIVIYGDNTQIQNLKLIRDLIVAYTDSKPRSQSKKKAKYRNLSQACEFVIIYKKDVSKIKQFQMDNWYHVEDVNSGKFKPLQRVATANYMRKTMLRYNLNLNDAIGLSLDLQNDLAVINKYIDTNVERYKNVISYNNQDADLLEFITESHIKNDALDWLMMERFLRIKKLFSRSIALNVHLGYHLEPHGSAGMSHTLMRKYHIAQNLIREGVPVDIIFHDSFRDYVLSQYVLNDSVSYRYVMYSVHESSAVTCLYEDFYGQDEYLKQIPDETDKGGFAKAV
jgi:hypothetical protein